MEKEELQKQIALYYSKLPTDAKAIFSSMNWLETLKGIAAKHALNDAQIEILGTETMLVLLGIIHEEEYNQILKKELGLPGVTADMIISEINEKVIKTIRPQLTQAFNQNSKEGELQNLEQELDERFQKLPENIKKIVEELNYFGMLYQIGEENNLSIPQMGALEEITTNVIVGAMRSENFEETVKKRLDLDAGKTKTVATEVNEKILKKIRAKMMSPDSTATPETHPMIANKLSGSVKISPAQTEYSLNNMSKPSDASKISKPEAASYKTDPYREPLA